MLPLLAPIGSVRPTPVDDAGAIRRLRLTLVAAGQLLLAVPALTLLVLTALMLPLAVIGVGLLLAWLVVPTTAALAGVHRRLNAALLDSPVPAAYAPAGGSVVATPLRWLRDRARWRDVAFLAFSATGGLVLSAVPVLLLAAPVAHLLGLLLDRGPVWLVLLLLSAPGVLVWWLVTPALVRARACAERAILGHGRVERLERRVEQVEESRAETLDHSAAEVRRIERDLHDGAQARIAAVGMNVGLAEKLLTRDPAAAAELLREARETTVTALEDLRSVVRGIHPPVLADRGLEGAVEALALALPLPVARRLDLPARLPAPVESAAYFAVAECLANVAKHARATRAWVTAEHRAGVLRIVVGDDGRGGADAAGTGLRGLVRRLGAFDGSVAVDSPAGGPTVVTLEVPCRSLT